MAGGMSQLLPTGQFAGWLIDQEITTLDIEGVLDDNEQVYIYFESRPSLSLRTTRSSLYPLARDNEDSIGDVVTLLSRSVRTFKPC